MDHAGKMMSTNPIIVWVAPGSYDSALKEQFPIIIPRNVQLHGDTMTRGAGSPPTLVQGEGPVTSEPINLTATFITGENSSIQGFKIRVLGASQISAGIFLKTRSNIMNNTFEGPRTGIRSPSNIASCPPNVMIDSNTFLNDEVGIYEACEHQIMNNNFQSKVGVECMACISNITDNTFRTSNVGVVVSDHNQPNPNTPKLRGNKFVSGVNTTGVKIEGAAIPDLGTDTTNDPGRNDFAKLMVAIYFSGKSEVMARGNIWNVVAIAPTIFCTTTIKTSNTSYPPGVVYDMTPDAHCPP